MSRLAFDENNYRDHAIDYIEDLMAKDDRAAFEGALAKNPTWLRYVDELRTTWRRARVVLNEGAQTAPSRVRMHVLAEAAKRAAILRKACAAKVSVAVAAPGLWAWVKQNLLGRPWFAPAFVATAAVGLYVFSQQTFKDARPSAVTSETVKQEPAFGLNEPKPQQSPAPSAAAPKPMAEPIADDKVIQRRAKSKPASQPREENVAPMKKSIADDFARRRGPVNDSVESDEGIAAGSSGIGSLAPSRNDSAKGFAQPPAGWSSAPAAPAPVPSRSAASGGRAPGVAQEKKEEQDSESSADSAEPSLADLVTKAESAERDEQWTAAVESYQQLLRRFPADKNAPKWKQRLAAASAHFR